MLRSIPQASYLGCLAAPMLGVAPDGVCTVLVLLQARVSSYLTISPLLSIFKWIGPPTPKASAGESGLFLLRSSPSKRYTRVSTFFVIVHRLAPCRRYLPSCWCFFKYQGVPTFLPVPSKGYRAIIHTSRR